MLCMCAIVKPGLAISGSAVSAGTAEFSAAGQQIYNIIARLYLCGEEFYRFRAGGHTDGLAACIYAENHRLLVSRTPIKELDSKWGSSLNFCLPIFEKVSGFCWRAGHQWLTVHIDYINMSGHQTPSSPCYLMQLKLKLLSDGSELGSLTQCYPKVFFL